MKRFVGFGILLSCFSISIFSQTFTEILGRPTDVSITVSILFDQKVDEYIEYGIASGNYTNITSTITNTANTPDEIEISNLLPDTKYFYRTRFRLTGSGSIFSASNEHSFHTQRPTGSSFTFTMEADEHLYDKKGVRSIYQICLANQAKDNPDFMFTLGDIFGDDHTPLTTTSADMDALHKDYRQYLGQICHSIPFYVCIGNHEGEKDYYLHQSPPNNIAVYGTLWRKFYYPNPSPNSFYTGNNDVEGFGMDKPENYYAYTWGDALFVVLDVYRYDSETSEKPGGWDWTLGQAQYDWLKTTLETSTSKYKFVLAHHVSGEGRGGIVQAKKFEWGGYAADGVTYDFKRNRPNMAKPIHQLFVDNGVNIFFQGHDHLFAHEIMDGVTYQEVPMPSDSTYEIGMLANADAYVSDTIEGTGHLKVTVNPTGVKVDFIRAFLPADTLSGQHHNGEIGFSYTIGNFTETAIPDFSDVETVKLFPNPAKDKLSIRSNQNTTIIHVKLLNILGQTLFESNNTELDVSNIPTGIYCVNITTLKTELNKKIIISR